MLGKYVYIAVSMKKKGNIRRVIEYPNARFFSFSWVRSRLRGELARMDPSQGGQAGLSISP